MHAVVCMLMGHVARCARLVAQRLALLEACCSMHWGCELACCLAHEVSACHLAHAAWCTLFGTCYWVYAAQRTPLGTPLSTPLGALLGTCHSAHPTARAAQGIPPDAHYSVHRSAHATQHPAQCTPLDRCTSRCMAFGALPSTSHSVDAVRRIARCATQHTPPGAPHDQCCLMNTT